MAAIQHDLSGLPPRKGAARNPMRPAAWIREMLRCGVEDGLNAVR